MNLIDLLNWRYATKKMNPARAVPQDKVDRIVEAIRLAPTSSGLQPFELVVVTNPGLRARIREIAMNQGQVVDCSHLLVFAAWDDYTPARIDRMFDYANEVRGTRNEFWESYRRFLLDTYPGRPEEINFQHAARQAYLAMGTGLVAAAAEQVDATPMEGFEPDRLDELLDLRSRGLRSVLLMPLGYREPEGDWLVRLPKIRRPRNEFVSELR